MKVIDTIHQSLSGNDFEMWVKIIGSLGALGTVFSLIYLIFFQQRRNNLQQFESSLFNLLSLHNQIVSNLQMKEFDDVDIYLNGRSVFNLVRRSIESLYKMEVSKVTSDNNIVKNAAETLEDARCNIEINFYSMYYTRFEPYLNHYFRNLYHIFLYIDDSTLIQSLIPWEKNRIRYKYAKIVRAQLSQNELFAIMLNCIMRGYGYPDFLKLDKKYKILQNFRQLDVKPSVYYQLYLNFKDSIKSNTKIGGIIPEENYS